jgi:arylsulfatase A-like enzyme
MIHNIDWNVGRILNQLDSLGIANNTMVVFLSDHGDMLGQHGSFCGIKNQAYRAAMHVPLIIRYPDQFTPAKTNAMVDVGVDMMPTLLDLCSVAAPSGMDGSSYLPVLQGKATEARDAIMYQVFTQTGGNPGEFAPFAERGIRTKDWLYVRHKEKRVMLYNEREDHNEQVNLVQQSEFESLMDEFDQRITAHMQATGDDWDMAADFPPPDFVTHAEAKEHLENVLLPSAIHIN